MDTFDVIILGAGAAGLMCAIEAGKRGRRVLVIDHAARPGRKILSSGGGHSNFTNRHIDESHYISNNAHFCRSALSRFTQWDFIRLLDRHNIAYQERERGRFFCTNSSGDIVRMLLGECESCGVLFQLSTTVAEVEKRREGVFLIDSSHGSVAGHSLVIATGGLSRPALGASPLGYRIAEQFQIGVITPRPALVPLTFRPRDAKRFSDLSGISVEALVGCGRQEFLENILFTHRGISGPAILQISLYWEPGEEIVIDLLPAVDLYARLIELQHQFPRRLVKTALVGILPRRLIQIMLTTKQRETPLGQLTPRLREEISGRLKRWKVLPGGTEGQRTAEVTRGGVDCNALSSKTMEVREVPGLYFIGEVLDVTGRLGGYNLQWAWSSGWCAGQAV